MKRLIPLFLVIIFFLNASAAFSEEHIIESGETALQIAIEHNLTMDQLQQLNPEVDLEMMLVGDVLIVPDEGLSFGDFLNSRYSEFAEINGLNCEIMLDQSALCCFHIENRSDLPLFDVHLQAVVHDRNGMEAAAEYGIPLMQILPGEKLPVCMIVPGYFAEISGAEVNIRKMAWSDMFLGSFRIPEEMYVQTDSILPDGIAAASSILFNEAAASVYMNKHINVLAAAYDVHGELVGIRSLYSDFYPRLDITVYSNNHQISSVEIRLEAY